MTDIQTEDFTICAQTILQVWKYFTLPMKHHFITVLPSSKLRNNSNTTFQMDS